MKNRGVGFYFTLIACILAAVDLFLYGKVMYTMPVVYGVLIAVIVVEVVAIVLNKPALNALLPLIGAVLLGYAAAKSFYVMVNQIGYVIAALDTIDTIYSFIVFVAVAVVGMLLYMIAGFLKQTKN